jgi:hypothetical protein
VSRRIVRRRDAIHAFGDDAAIPRNQRTERTSAIADILQRNGDRATHELGIRVARAHTFTPQSVFRLSIIVLSRTRFSLPASGGKRNALQPRESHLMRYLAFRFAAVVRILE